MNIAWKQPEMNARAAWWGVAIACAAAVLLAVWLVLNPFRASPAAAAITLDKVQSETLAKMSTGEIQDAVATGDSAVERNARIPIERLASGKVRGFTDIPAGSPAFATAEKCLTQAIYYEAANESLQGKRAVAQVVLNRLRHPAYPDSVCGVVYEGSHQAVCQFSFTCDGSLLRAPLAAKWQESEEVARRALQGATEPSVGTATHYHADYVLPRWAFTLGKINQIDRHIFYRFRSDWGGNRAFRESWSGRETIPPLDREWLVARMAGRGKAVDPVETFVPGLTVTPDVKDRHAENDVGGRLDTTKGWQLSIPDPTVASTSYRSQLETHGAADPATEMDDGGSGI